MTDAELITRLIGETKHAPDWRSGCVRAGHLPVFDYWGPVMYLTPAGDIVRQDEEGGPVRPATPDERDFGLARAAEWYPDLAHLRPSPPPGTAICEWCGGRGKVRIAQGRLQRIPDGHEPDHFLYCPACNSLGWPSGRP